MKTERHFHGVQPAAGFRQGIQPARKQGEQGERDRKRERKSRHPHEWAEVTTAVRGFHQQGTDDRAGTTEGDERERECHEEDADQSAAITGGIGFVDDPARQRDLERAEEGDGKDDEDDEERQVEKALLANAFNASEPKVTVTNRPSVT